MKQSIKIFSTAIFLLFVSTLACAQKKIDRFKTMVIEPYPLEITYNKTTNLIFPYTIKSVDKGSREILAQKAKGVDNILLLKAGSENFTETNLSVITSDGRLYSFVLSYTHKPEFLNIAFTKEAVAGTAVLQTEWQNTEALLERTAEKIALQKRAVHAKKHRKYGMRLRLNGLYIDRDILYFQVELQNQSNIAYDIDLFRFSIKDNKSGNRTASQEIELLPLYTYGATSGIKEGSKNMLVFALPKFTIPDRKHLLLQLMEKNGGRHLKLHITNHTIIHAQALAN